MAGAMDWISLKTQFVDAIGLDRDALHIYAGVLIQLVASRFCRNGLASLWPLAAVIGLEGLNEYFDLFEDPMLGAARAAEWAESRKDFLNTLVFPIGIFIAARMRQRRRAPSYPAPSTIVAPLDKSVLKDARL